MVTRRLYRQGARGREAYLTSGSRANLSTKAGRDHFINPLMTLYFGFELTALAERSLYLRTLHDTETIFDVGARIEGFRKTASLRTRRLIPH